MGLVVYGRVKEGSEEVKAALLVTTRQFVSNDKKEVLFGLPYKNDFTVEMVYRAFFTFFFSLPPLIIPISPHPPSVFSLSLSLSTPNPTFPFPVFSVRGFSCSFLYEKGWTCFCGLFFLSF